MLKHLHNRMPSSTNQTAVEVNGKNEVHLPRLRKLMNKLYTMNAFTTPGNNTVMSLPLLPQKNLKQCVS